MKLKATKTLANELNKMIDKYNIYGVRMHERDFSLRVDLDIYKHGRDFDHKTNTFGVIVVEYPNNYYACNKYITTNDLVKIWKNTNDKTINGLAKAFCEFVEI